MEALVSDLTKKPFKNWKNLLQTFLCEPVIEHAKQHDDGLSCFLMGLCFEQGILFSKNYDSALEYLRQGANKRDPLCLYRLYEIYSGKNYYGIEPDREVAFLYLVWSVVYMFPIYGSYMCLDLDLELQSYYKNTLKQNKHQVFQIIDDYDDDIFAHDKELIKCVFGFLIEFISPAETFNVQEEYQKMINSLMSLAERGDSRFAALFLFKCVLWDFKGVTDRNHKKILNIIKKRKCVSFIFQQLQSVFNYISVTGKKHTIFSRLLHFHSIEIFWQIKYNSDAEDVRNKEEACKYLTDFLYKNLCLMDNNFTRSMTITLMAKSYINSEGVQRDLSQALNVIESFKQVPGLLEQDFPFLLGGKLCSELGQSMKSDAYFEKHLDYSNLKSNLPTKYYDEGKFYEHYKRDPEKAIEAYVKGLYSPPDSNTFLQESYSRKCKDRIWKLIRSNKDLYHKFYPNLEKIRFFHDDEEN